jgi:hypothetical protein
MCSFLTEPKKAELTLNSAFFGEEERVVVGEVRGIRACGKGVCYLPASALYVG